jgi:ribose 5-phosphate isomerase B
VIARLRSQGHDVVDLGPPTSERCDYPVYAAKVARAVRDEAGARGILVCASGLGIAIAANKIRGIRAADAWNVETGRLCRSHNDANVLCLGERMIDETTAFAIVDVFLTTPAEGGRHLARVAQIADLEAEESSQSSDQGSVSAAPPGEHRRNVRG